MKKGTDLLLVRPGDKRNIYGDLSFTLAAVEPPLWAALLASYTRESGYSVKILDVEAENISVEEAALRMAEIDASLVVFTITGSNLSASTWKMAGAGELARCFKQNNPDTPQLFWGLHPSALPGQTLGEEACDYVCRGEGFQTVTELLEVLSGKSTLQLSEVPGLCFLNDDTCVINDYPEVVRDLDSLPMAAWDLLPMDKYRAHNWQCFEDIENRAPYAVIHTSLGCPYSCSFCALRTLFGKPGIRYRSPYKVMEEIDLLVNTYGIKNFKIIDECFVISHKHTGALCDLLIERDYDLNIWAYARIDTVTPEILQKMRRAGVRWLCYGIESGSDRVLESISKGRFNKDKIREVVAMTHEAGIHILANFLFGLEDDDMDSMQETLDFAVELKCAYTNFYSVMAYPGSSLYDRALKENIPLPDTWLGYSQFSQDALPLPTKHLTSSQVLAFRDEAFVKFHSDPSYIAMLENKFDSKVAEHVAGLLKHTLKRNNI